MLNNLERVSIENENIIPKEAHKFQEFAILYELNGDYSKAIENYKKALANAKNEFEKERIKLGILELSHGRVEESFDEIDQTIDRLTSASRVYQHGFLGIGIKFWLTHIKIHLGIFNHNEMLEIVESIVYNFEALYLEEPYKIVHLLRRSFFDVWRLIYLKGEPDLDKYLKLYESKASTILQNHMVLFNAYYKKHIAAQLLHYKVIYDYSIYNKEVKEDMLRKIGINISDNNLQNLIKTTEAFYIESYEIFKSYGNKSDKSINLRLAEIEMMKDDFSFEKVSKYISDYRVYINDKNIPDFYGNLATLEAKVKLISFRKRQLSDISDVAEKKLESEYKSLQFFLDEAIDFYQSNNNKYGILRVKFIQSISALIKDHNLDLFRDNMSVLLDEAREHSYKREFDLIKLLLDDKGIEMNIINKIIRFYPIVIQ